MEQKKYICARSSHHIDGFENLASMSILLPEKMVECIENSTEEFYITFLIQNASKPESQKHYYI
jgi:hypothetical protein